VASTRCFRESGSFSEVVDMVMIETEGDNKVTP
jgi:hypothetical protein